MQCLLPTILSGLSRLWKPPLIFVGRESGAFAKYSSTKLDLGPLLELKGYTKAVTGIALPSAEEALTASMDGTVRQRPRGGVT